MDKKTFIAKYNQAVSRIAAKNNVDLGVAGDMFLHNAKVLSAAAKKAGADWYNGTGIVNIDQLFADYAEYEKSIKKAK